MSENDNKEGVASEETTTDEKTQYEKDIEQMHRDGLYVECPNCGADHNHIFATWNEPYEAPVVAYRDSGELFLSACEPREQTGGNFGWKFRCDACGETSEHDEDFIITAEQRSALNWLEMTEALYLDPDALSKPKEYKD